MTGVLIIGADPGVTTGIMGLRYPCEGHRSAWSAIQCDHGSALVIIDAQMGRVSADVQVFIALEGFIDGRRSNTREGKITRELVMSIKDTWPAITVLRRATDVKPWATDYRLSAIGAIDKAPNMRHARDAGRHALFCAVHDLSIPDPLSRKAA
jgi:hypothetical protein